MAGIGGLFLFDQLQKWIDPQGYQKREEEKRLNKQYNALIMDQKRNAVNQAFGFGGVRASAQGSQGGIENDIAAAQMKESTPQLQAGQPQPYMHDRDLPADLAGGQMMMGNFPSAGTTTPGFGMAGGGGLPATQPLAPTNQTGITGKGGPVYTDGPRIEDPNKAFADLMAAMNMGSFQTSIDSSRFKGGIIRGILGSLVKGAMSGGGGS